MFFRVLCDFFFFKQKTAYEMRISDWSSDVCSSDLDRLIERLGQIARELGLCLLVVLDGLRAIETCGRNILEIGLAGGVEMLLLEIEHRLLHALLVHGVLRSNCWFGVRWFRCTQGADRCSVASARIRSEEHTSELQSLMRISYAVFC